MQQADNYITPNWSAPQHVHAYTSTRIHGASTGPYAQFNLAGHIGDEDTAVQSNRQQLIAELKLPAMPTWLRQVHGTTVINLDHDIATAPEADAVITSTPNRICAVLTADCLPILLCANNGQEVAAIHAGWRGLLAGIIDSTLATLTTSNDSLLAWLGPAIGPQSFAINEEIRHAYLTRNDTNHSAFTQRHNCWHGDLYQLARINLTQLGVSHISGGGFCTYQDKRRFFSYRRARGLTGRMVSLIWIQAQ